MIVHTTGVQMVNKALLSLAAVVLFVVFGTGVFVGMLVGGPTGDGAGTADTGPQATATPAASDLPTTATPAASDSPATATPDAGSDSTATPPGDTDAERNTVPPREFNEANISAAIVENVNAAREDQGLQALSSTGTTAENVRQMAAGHSDAMADAGLVRHTIDGVTSRDRYKRSDLYNTCQFQVASYIEDADNNGLEVIGRTYAGQEYPDGGTQAFNENETAVANALTDDWLSTPLFRDRLLLANADDIGVGVTLTSTGAVYATANLC